MEICIRLYIYIDDDAAAELLDRSDAPHENMYVMYVLNAKVVVNYKKKLIMGSCLDPSLLFFPYDVDRGRP